MGLLVAAATAVWPRTNRRGQPTETRLLLLLAAALLQRDHQKPGSDVTDVGGGTRTKVFVQEQGR